MKKKKTPIKKFIWEYTKRITTLLRNISHFVRYTFENISVTELKIAALFCRAKYPYKRVVGPHCRNVQKRGRGV